MIGKLPKSSKAGHVYLLVAVDKFTKWIDAMPVTNQEGKTAVKFFESIVYRFGMPHSIITNNGSNFISKEFQDFCEGLRINITYSSVAHPQTNGQVEKANGLIGAGIKKRLMSPLERLAGAWMKELPFVLWSLRTTPNSSTGYTTFFMVHGAGAVLPAEVHHQVPRVVAYSEAESTAALKDAVDTLDEARDIAASRSVVYQQSLRNYHSRRLRPRSIVEGDLVLRLKQERSKKFESPWEGPYIVTEVIPGDAYRLKHVESRVAYSNPWNVVQLRRFYP
jgi:transposase InsO family protein